MPAGNRSGIHHERCRHTATVGNAQAYDRSYTYDQAGRLTTVADRTATVAMGSLTPDTTASAAAPCQVRSYGFNSDGARTSCGVENHSDGDCTSTTAGTVTTATTAYHVDTADRFTTAATTGGSTGAGYGYDGLGRQTSIPGADTPAGAGAGDLTLGYYVDDLPRSVSQHGVTSTFILDAAGRRVTQTVTGGTDDGTTIARHYTDTSDNPGWETTTPAGGGATTLTRFTDSLDGALGAMITGTGEATILLVDPHGNNVTSVTISSGVSTSEACTGIDAWNSYTEYGTPSAGTTPSGTVTGPLGYGWVGAHQRATGPDTAGLTLMGVRYYNPVTGAFASPDPIPGGNNTSYGYPGDPINTTDLTGQCL